MPRTLRLIVGPERVAADAGPTDAECLRVRRAGSAQWETFYDEIHGFDHEPGVSYEIEVRVSELDAPAADGSSLRYDLIRIIGRIPDDG